MIETAILCLALNDFHEARGEPIKGRMAVAMVVRNRAKYDPDKVCDVVFKPYQFSWTLTMPGTPSSQEFEQSIRIVNVAWQSVDFTNGSLYYHKDTIRPYWAKYKKRTMKIGRHIFYR